MHAYFETCVMQSTPETPRNKPTPQQETKRYWYQSGSNSSSYFGPHVRKQGEKENPGLDYSKAPR